MSSNNSKPRNPLQELPISTYTRSASSSLASSSGGTTPSSVSSLLSSGSTSSASSRTGSGRIVHLPLSSPSQDSSSSRTVRPSVQPPSPSARRWPISTRHARGSSLSSQTLTPGRLPHGLASSPLNPRSSTAGTPSAEERRSARRQMMDEADGAGAGMNVDQDEDEGRTVRRRGSTRDRDREMMPPPAVPLPARPDPSMTPGRSPARRLFTAPHAEATPRRSPISTGTLQPSPPLSTRTLDSSTSRSEADETDERKIKPRARTSTGRDSPVPPPVTSAVVAESTPSRTADEEVSKKVRLDELSSVAKGKQRMDVSEDLVGSAGAVQTADEEEQLARQRMENVDPHNCGFTVWEDMNGAGPSSSSSTSSARLTSSSTSNISIDSPSSTSMSEKNKKALAWLMIPFDNQENIKPPPTNVMVSFLMDTGGKGKASGPAGSSKSSASTSGASTSSAASSSTAVSSGVSAPQIAASSVPARTIAVSVRSSPVASPRNETSIRSTMRGNIAPISTGGSLRGLECASPVKAATTPGPSVAQAGEGSPTPTLKLRRTMTSLTASRSFPPTSTGTSIAPARPVLVLRRTGSAENVNTFTANSPTSRTSTESALEQENAAITVSMVNDDTKDKHSGEEKSAGDGRKGRVGRRKRKSGEMADSSSELQSDSANKKPPTRSTTAFTPASAVVQGRAQGRRTRRSAGGSTGNEKKSAAAGSGKKGTEIGYKGRVLRSMTRAGNGL